MPRNRFFLPVLAVTGALLAAGAPGRSSASAADGNTAPTEARPADVPPELWRKLQSIDERLADVEDLTASFEKRKHTPLLKEPLISRGTVRATREKARWDTAEPSRSVTLLTQDQLRIYYPAQHRLEIYPLRQRFAQFGASPIPRMSEFVRHFSIEQRPAAALFEDLEEQSGDPAGQASEQDESNDEEPRYLALAMTPKSEKHRDRVRRIDLLFDRETGHLKRLRLREESSEHTEYRFSEVKLNVGLEPGVFELDLPDDVKVSRPLEGGG